ncbi:MAG TPA: DUF1697 domain-containing protein [Chthoniobacterales bacterium]
MRNGSLRRGRDRDDEPTDFDGKTRLPRSRARARAKKTQVICWARRVASLTMPRYVAFLRGINLGKRRPAMSELRKLFEELRFSQVETFIASGNVIFSIDSTDTARLEREIERRLEKSLGYRVDTFVRSREEVVAIGGRKIFPDEKEPGITVHVGFLHQQLASDIARKLAAVRSRDDALRVIGREYYWLCRVRTSDSKIWSAPELRALRLPTSSMRNLTSIRKLIAKHFA